MSSVSGFGAPLDSFSEMRRDLEASVGFAFTRNLRQERTFTTKKLGNVGDVHEEPSIPIGKTAPGAAVPDRPGRKPAPAAKGRIVCGLSSSSVPAPSARVRREGPP